jgi:hypothetical protein
MMVAPISNNFGMSGSSSREMSTSKWYPIRNLKKLKITVEVNEIERLSGLAFEQSSNDRNRDYQRLISKTMNALLLPSLGLIISINFIFYFLRKLTQNKSIMAFCIGGHAPPVMFY